jgi:ribose-phosphate pyrophosphokinase
MGGSKRAMPILNFLEFDNCYKTKKKANVIDTMELIGEVKGRKLFL